MQHQKRKLAAKRIKCDGVLVMVIVAISLGILFYPAAANWVNSRIHAQQLTAWSQTVTNIESNELTNILYQAEKYNERLALGLEGLKDETDPAYLAQLHKPGTNVMARIIIPAISVKLPVFHGTSDAVLGVGAGHLYGTALPVGNDSKAFGTHSVITAHSGIATNSLFNDLHIVTYGEIFMVDTAGRQLFYRIDQITVVEANAVKQFPVEPGQDIVTLLTCTPIGINSHRLLITGTRYRPEPSEAEKIISQTAIGQRFPMFALLWAGPVAASGGITHLITKPRNTSTTSTLHAIVK